MNLVPRLKLFGSPDLVGPEGNRGLSILSQPKRLALLAYLAAATPRGFHSRDKLLALLWPRSDQDHARNSLRQSLHFLRHRLGSDVLVGRGDGEIGIDADLLACDVVEFEAALDAGELETALEIYQADLLDGFFVSDSGPFEDWLDMERTRLRRLAVAAAWRLCDAALNHDDHERTRSWGRRAVNLDPTSEVSIRRFIGVLAEIGEGAAAAEVYGDFEERLWRDHELTPAAETVAAMESLKCRSATLPTLTTAEGRGAETAPTPDRLRPSRVPRVLAAVRHRRPRERWPPKVTVPLVGGVTLALIVLLAAGIRWLLPESSRAGTESPPQSVAVLPFRSIGSTSDGGFFADAMHQEILTRLSGVRSLRVIARNSVVDVQLDMEDNETVARELGVRYLVRGALQNTDGRVRVWARLIDASSDEQLWATRTEAGSDDLYEIQSQVAESITEALRSRFQPRGVAATATVRPTDNSAAYEAYLRGRLHASRLVNRDDAREAVRYMEEAVRLDGGFAAAYAILATSRLLLAQVFEEPDQGEPSDSALRRAVELAPDDPTTWLAEAYHASYADQDYDQALARLAQVLAMRPSDAEALALKGFVERRKGLWGDAATTMTRALELDPNSYTTTVVLAEMYVRMRQYDHAERLLDRAIAISPGGELAYVQKALLHLNALGDTAGARTILERAPTALSPKNHALPALIALYRNDDQEALTLLLRSPASPEDRRSPNEMVLLGLVRWLRGEHELARAWADSITEMAPAPGVGADALAEADGYTALAAALSGRADEAVAVAERSRARLPLTRDAYAGTEVLERVAQVYALIGRTSEAVAILDRLLAVPSRVTPDLLRMHPAYSPIRDDPGFQRLLSRPGVR